MTKITLKGNTSNKEKILDEGDMQSAGKEYTRWKLLVENINAYWMILTNPPQNM